MKKISLIKLASDELLSNQELITVNGGVEEMATACCCDHFFGFRSDRKKNNPKIMDE